MAKVFIGVGHGGADPGAVANGFREKDLNLSIALACHTELVRHGVTVQMSRVKDDDETLNEKISECNAFNPDLALDIHNNAGGGDGAEVYCSIRGGIGKTLGQNILAEMVAIGQNSRGVKTKKNSAGIADYYGFIRNMDDPARAVIVECAFMDTEDVKIIDTAAEQRDMGVAIAKGILATLGITYTSEADVRFADVSEKAWYADEVAYATALGIVDGVGGNQFEPDRPITRAECAAIAVRLYKLLNN